MKKLFVFAIVAIGITIFNGCQKSDEQVLIDEVQPQVAVKPDVYVENGYLAFKNMEAVDSVIQLLSTMNRMEKEAWEQQIGFKSARSDFDVLFDEYDKLESYEDFLSFKEKNLSKLKFNEMDEDDCSIEYPFATKMFLPILNEEGVFKAGITLFKYTKDNQYMIVDGDTDKLNNLEAFTDDNMVISLPKLKSTTTTIHAFPEDNPNGDYNEYHRKPNISNRKLKNELFVDRYIENLGNGLWKRGYYVVVNQHGQKLSWGKWRDYDTVYSMRKIRVEIGSTIYYQDLGTHISSEVKPYINFTLGHNSDIISWPIPYTPPLLSVPDIDYAAEISFRGFGFDNSDYYKIDIPENYPIASTNNYPSSNWAY